MNCKISGRLQCCAAGVRRSRRRTRHPSATRPGRHAGDGRARQTLYHHLRVAVLQLLSRQNSGSVTVSAKLGNEHVYRSSCRDKHNCQRRDSNLDPLTPQSDAPTTRLLRPAMNTISRLATARADHWILHAIFVLVFCFFLPRDAMHPRY